MNNLVIHLSLFCKFVNNLCHNDFLSKMLADLLYPQLFSHSLFSSNMKKYLFVLPALICMQTKIRSIKTNNVFKIILKKLLQAMYSFIYNALVYYNFLKAMSYYCYPTKPDKYCPNLSDLDITQFHFLSVVCFLIF